MAKIFIGIPQYRMWDGQEVLDIAQKIGLESVYQGYGMHPVVSNMLVDIMNNGTHDVDVFFNYGDACLERARTILFGRWLQKQIQGPGYDYYMCLDEDVSFEPTAFDGIIDAMEMDSGIRAVSIPYTYKADRGNPKHRLSVCRFYGEPETTRKGFVRGLYGNGGAMIMECQLMVDMMAYYPELYVKWNTNMEGHRIHYSYALWLPMVHNEELLSEDYAFSRRLNDMGEVLWFYLYAPTTHWKGAIPYRVDYSNVPSR